MNYSDKLRTAIQERNVIHARTAILSYLDSDATEAMPQALRIAVEIADKFSNPEEPFFDQENHRLEIPSQAEWDSAFLRKIKAALQANFSREKLELAEQVISYLRAQGFRDFQVKEAKNTPRRPQGKPGAGRHTPAPHSPHQQPESMSLLENGKKFFQGVVRFFGGRNGE